MAYDVGAYRDFIVATLANGHVTLTQAQKDALAAELATDPEGLGYAGKTAGQKLTLLCTPRVTQNPVAQTRVPRPTWIGSELKLKLMELMHTDGVTPLYMQMKKLFVSTDTKLKAIAEKLVEIASVERPNAMSVAFFIDLKTRYPSSLSAEAYNELTTIPDPNWQPEVEMPARSDAILGPGICPTLEDLA